jgi:hypothetical protein
MRRCWRCKEKFDDNQFFNKTTRICNNCRLVCAPSDGTRLDGYRVRAFKKGVPFNLTEENISIPEFCPVYGIKFSIDPVSDYYPQLDRMIPKLGYVKGNVYFISAKANKLKNNASLEDLELIVKYMKLYM